MHTVLLVDDEPTIIMGLKRLFDWKHAGFRIVGELSNGDDAYDKILAIQPDLVLTDLRMPGLQGLDLIKAAKRRGLRCQFIVISGYNDFAYCQEALRLGAIDYLLKPIDFTLLGKRVHEIAEKLDELEMQNFIETGIEHESISESIRKHIYLNYAHKISLNELANIYHLNPSYLCRLFKKEQGANLSEYHNRVRIQNAKGLMTSTHLSIHEISEKVGYSDYRYFSKVFKMQEGSSPFQYRKTIVQ